MRLLVVSHTPHHWDGSRYVGWGPTVRELDYLAEHFGELVHLATLHAGPAPSSALPYHSSKVRLVLVPPAGGDRLREKLGIAGVIPQYFSEITRLLSQADAVHVRCPANIALIALVVLLLNHRPRYRWFKYAGNWAPEPGQGSLASTLQRMVLWRRWAGGVVTINGRWPGQPSHMFSFFNPCLTRDEVAQARQTVASKQLVAPIRFIFVGSIAAFKGVEMALQVIDALKRSGISLVFDIIGDGPDLPRYQKLVEGWGLGEVVNFHGWVPRPQLAPYYTRAHFQLLPSRAEGWPKVLSEGMAYGVVPIASAISSIPQILGELGCGAAVPISAEAFIRTVQLYLDEPKRWSIEAERGREAVQRFTYEHYLGELDRIFAQTWNTVPPGIAAE